MPIERARFARQMCLPEIGEAGQDRLMSATVKPTGMGDARETEILYLERAGVIVDTTSHVKTKVNVNDLAVRDLDAREIADGALRALIAMRKILEIG